ncbi:2-dehydro-3-deoxygalactonokinase [Roseovarius pelagicus]|uniref:2-dehydro-3-deoxygalactonokinase n=1 Tax=Roseovarius pelagicus TaxID=2980108 RepID=A0ABY6D9S2_9RHOB|nr:2-dehydro-3-deoxygalactonokinase [Roseovarius pelagicus]UXX81933.1 2-dehydro-3-deoxygalactonokinase [Roseovarius pelagicus]
MALWLAYGPDDVGVRVCLMEGKALQGQSLHPDTDDALAAVVDQDRTKVRIGGTTPQAVPVAVMPTSTDGVPIATQEAPPDALGGWARLRIAGVLSSRPNWDGVVVDVRDQITHWVHVSAGEIVSLQGFATGRLVSALGGNAEAAPDAVEQTLSRPEKLAAHLHTASLGGDMRALTGHLIGAEIAAAKPYWLGQEVIVVAERSALVQTLQYQGTSVDEAMPQDMLVRGLAAFADAAGYLD